MLHSVLKTSARLSLAAGAALACVSTAAAQHENVRYISIAGNDANACTLAAPCHSLQVGINRTPAGGDLRILDSGIYGRTVTIDKSMTISGDGHTVALRSPITINNADATVALRGLVLDGGGSVANGVLITAAAAVHIEGCTVHGFTEYGLYFHGTNAALFFLDSIARDNGFAGLYVDATGTTARVTVDNARFEHNASDGLDVIGGTAAVTRTVAAGNEGAGYFVSGGELTLESSAAHGNAYGLYVSTGGTARISNSAFVDNAGYGIINSSSTLQTRQNNTVSGNTVGQTSGTLTPLGGI